MTNPNPSQDRVEEQPTRAMIDAGMKAFGDTELAGTHFTERALIAAITAALNTRSESEPVTVMREALEKIEAGSNLGKLTFELRVKERNNRLTWYAVNVLEDNLAACAGTAREALARIGRSV